MSTIPSPAPGGSGAAATDTAFGGSIAEQYETLMVPLIFEPYAADLAPRVAARRPADVLEVAAGTGVVTRRLAALLPPACTIVATDLNQPMVDHAAAIGTARPVQWRTADAMALPFGDASVDAVVCQFGAMFFPDRPHAYREARRVLRPGGAYLFNVWDAIGSNAFADEVTRALGARYPADPPRFMARVPHGYHDRAAIARDLAAGGFERPARIERVVATSRAASARIVATAYCHGTPLRHEIESREPGGLAAATDEVTAALEARFGRGPVEGPIAALVVIAER